MIGTNLLELFLADESIVVGVIVAKNGVHHGLQLLLVTARPIPQAGGAGGRDLRTTPYFIPHTRDTESINAHYLVEC